MIIGSNQLPVGFRFMPTDEELVTHYLMNKVLYRPVPAAQEIREIDAARFYSNHPKNLVTFSCGEREWFFFIHQGESSHASQTRSSIRVVGNGLGFWKPKYGSETPIFDEDGHFFASKISLTYFSGRSASHAKRTHWKMVEYYVHEHDRVESNTEEKYQVADVYCNQCGQDYTEFWKYTCEGLPMILEYLCREESGYWAE